MKNNKVLVAAVLLLVAMAAGVAYAQPKEQPKAEKPAMKVEKCVNCQGGGMGMNMGKSDMPDMPGMMGMMMPDLPPDVEKKVIDQQIKFVKATASLRADLEQKQLEMKQLWLDSEPNADKIVAKMNEIDKVEVQLKEQGIRNRLAVYGLLPKDARKGFLRGCCGGGMGMCGGMCGGMGMGPGMMGTGPQVRIEKRIIKKGSDEGENEKEE